MNFIEEKIGITIEKIKERIVTKRVAIDDIKWCPASYKTENVPPVGANWTNYEVHSFPIPGDSHMWFSFSVDVPQVAYDEVAYLKVTTNYDSWGATNPQALLYVDGTSAVQAFDENHMECPMEAGHHNVNVYLYGNPNGTVVIRFEAFILVKNKIIEKLYYDMHVPYEVMKLQDNNSSKYATTLNVLDRACLLLDFRSHKTEQFMQGIDKAIAFLETEYYQKHCGKEDNGELACIGHSHLDVAWYWTLAQTREKAQRTFSTAINLLNQYPDYVFMSSQPQLYQYVKESDPELYEKIKERVKENRWEPEGAMWLEPDLNLTSGESLIRQLLYGKRFMREEFGIENRVLWMPDVFGYSASLPQILKKSGIDVFFTTKLCWNETNTFPHTNFMWQGIDGSEVFSVQTDDVNKNLSPAHVKGAMDWHKDKRYSTTHIATIGYGDGGGGTTTESLEYHKRLKRGLPGMPKVTFRKAAQTLAITKKQFEENTKNARFVPRWVGELYLELHRGTYTTMAENKRNNRKSEILYQTAEELSVMAEQMLNEAYPTQILEKNWYPVLKNQFHDILPGSAIAPVYEDSRREYKEILTNGEKLLGEKLDSIAANVCTSGGYLVYNPTSFVRSEVVECDGKSFMAEHIPPHGYAVVIPGDSKQKVVSVEKCLENDCLRILFDDDYNIVSVYDKENGREVIKQNEKANVLAVYEDLPWQYEAWEIKEYYSQKKWLVDDVSSVELINKDLYAGIRITRNYGSSQIIQLIRLATQSRRIDFVTDIDWHEEQTLLKAEFPLAVHTNQVNGDIQFGYVDRPTHRNTSWDQTRFEFCAQKWADLSEGNYGVALLNDSKYGYSALGNVLTLSLLKAPLSPNPDADRGQHHFVYSLYPHNGTLTNSDVVNQGYMVNNPLQVRKLESNTTGAMPARFSFVQTDCDNAVVETIKKAEDGNGYIIRIFDSKNIRREVTLTFGMPVKKACICNLMEDVEEEIPVIQNNSVKFDLSNFEIKTLKIQF